MANKLTQRLNAVGQGSIHVLRDKRVIVFGFWWCWWSSRESCEIGIGHITIVDRDIVDETNIIASCALVPHGKVKVDVLKSRLLDINPCLITQSRRI